MRGMTLAALLAALAVCVVGKVDAKPKPAPHHSPRFLLAQQLNRALASSPLRGTGFALEDEAHRGNLNPYFIVGAGVTESGDGGLPGVHPCRQNRMNIWGLASCGYSPEVPVFKTWRDAYRSYIAFIHRHWPHARTLYELYGYCPPCGTQGWGDKTYGAMRHLFGNVSTSLEYPR